MKSAKEGGAFELNIQAICYSVQVAYPNSETASLISAEVSKYRFLKTKTEVLRDYSILINKTKTSI
jgi:hypothetical protein